MEMLLYETRAAEEAGEGDRRYGHTEAPRALALESLRREMADLAFELERCGSAEAAAVAAHVAVSIAELQALSDRAS